MTPNADDTVEHLTLDVRGGALHVARTGQGSPLLLLHGWPEFWLTWQPVMDRLRDRYMLIAPDLRGFGDSTKPKGAFGPNDHADDMIALLDSLALPRAGIVGHDVGGAVIQALARAAPIRCAGLFLFDFVYPGIGARMAEPDRLSEIWYQTFNQTDLAQTLVGSSRDTCAAYIQHFLQHWSHRKDAFDDVLDRFVDNFLKPGNLAGGFAHYKASHPSRIAMMKDKSPALPPIDLPTCVRWAEFDPIFPYSWTDLLTETFRNLDLAIFPGVGHFAHREKPDDAAREIDSFFKQIGWAKAIS